MEAHGTCLLSTLVVRRHCSDFALQRLGFGADQAQATMDRVRARDDEMPGRA